jgi:hypothetical protein
MGCTQGKQKRSGNSSANNNNSKKVKEHKRKEKSERTVYSEPTYHIKTEDYKANPPTVEPTSQGSISRDNTVTLSSNKDENLESDGIEKDKATEEAPHLERKGSIVRNGVYYSESELSEEVPWQPKYWNPERIGKWVEDTEFPDGMKYNDVCKLVIQNNMTVPRPRAIPQHQSPVNHNAPPSPERPS